MLANQLIELCSGKGERARLSILIFHRVLARPDTLFPGEMHAARFDMLMAHVRQRFNVLPLASAVESLRAGALPARALAITFDDGYADNLTQAAPVLRRHGLPATLFIATAYLDGGCMWNDVVIESCRRTSLPSIELTGIGLGRRATGDAGSRRALAEEIIDSLKYRDLDARDRDAGAVAAAAGVDVPRDLMLASGQLRDLAGYGISVGAHTCRHPILARTSETVAWHEITESRRVLADVLGHPVSLFAYPNGKPFHDYTAVHVRMVKEAGFSAAVSTAPGAATARSDFFQLPRFTPWREQPLRFDLLMARNLLQGAEQRAA